MTSNPQAFNSFVVVVPKRAYKEVSTLTTPDWCSITTQAMVSSLSRAGLKREQLISTRLPAPKKSFILEGLDKWPDITSACCFDNHSERPQSLPNLQGPRTSANVSDQCNFSFFAQIISDLSANKSLVRTLLHPTRQ